MADTGADGGGVHDGGQECRACGTPAEPLRTVDLTPLSGFSGRSHRIRQLLSAWVLALKPETRRAYQNDLADFARWLGAPDPLAAAGQFFALDVGQANHAVLMWRADLTQAGVSTATIARRISALRSLNTAARMCGLCTWAIEVKGPKVETFRDTAGPGELGWVKMREATAADPSLQGFRDRALVLLAHDLGLRRSEVAGLDLEHVEMTDGRPVAVWVLGKGRSERQWRSVPAPTARALLDWLERRGPEPGALFHRLDCAAASAGGGRPRLSGQSVADIVERLGKRAGLARKVKPHGLRHVAITEAARLFPDVEDVMDFARHANYNTTRKYIDRVKDRAGVVAAALAGEG